MTDAVWIGVSPPLPLWANCIQDITPGVTSTQECGYVVRGGGATVANEAIWMPGEIYNIASRLGSGVLERPYYITSDGGAWIKREVGSSCSGNFASVIGCYCTVNQIADHVYPYSASHQ